MNSRMRLLKFQRATLILVAMIFLAACNLNRAPIVWIQDVQPQFVCPGDNVTLSWNGGTEDGCLGGGCPEVVVSISSNPAEVLNPPLTSLRVQGETTAGPINSLTSFTFSATGGSDPRNPATHSIDVVLPERETFVPLDFAAACSGRTAVWQPVDLSIPEFRSEGVRLVRVCNTSGEMIQLTLTFGSGPMTWTLFPGRCTEDLPPDLGRNVLGAQASSLGGVPGTRCDTSMSLPPDIDTVAALACDLMSTAEPIVIASPETSTPEGTQSGIIPLWTETPNSTGFILIIQVPANCRQGPGTAYPVVNSALPGQQIQVSGKSADGTWWYSQVKNDKCWISNVAGTPTGDLSQLTIIPAPPTPVPTETKAPAEEKPVEQNPEPTNTTVAEPDNDGDGYPFSVDCNDKDPKINPGAVETLNDKVDNNCNGDYTK
jgi:uncharacterized protein YraI